MRFSLSLGLIAAASFASGYALMRPAEAPQGEPPSQQSRDSTAVVARPPLAPIPDRALTPPVDLFAGIAASDDRLSLGHRLFVAVHSLGAADFGALFAEPRIPTLCEQLKEVPDKLYLGLMQSLMRRWLEVDAPAALAWLPHVITYFNARRGAVHYMIAAVAETHPEAAVNYVSSLSPDELRDGHTQDLFEELAAASPAHAREFLRRVSDPATAAAAQMGYRFGLSRSDPWAALASVKAIPDAGERQKVLLMCTYRMERQSPDVVAEVCRNLDEPRLRFALLREMAYADPATAARTAGELLASPPPSEGKYDRQSYVSTAGKEFGRTDPHQAVAWALSLPDDIRLNALEAVSSGWAQIKPKEALLYLDEHLPRESEKAPGDGAPRSDPRITAFQEWVRADDTAARVWADALPPGDLRTAVQAALILNLAYDDRRSEELMRRASTLGREEFKSVASQVTQNLASTDARSAVDWASEVARTRQEYEPIEISVEHWFVADPQAAGSWVEALAPGPARDAGAAACARIAISMDAVSASAWVEQIADRHQRNAVAQQVAAEWKKRDAAAAEAWLGSVVPPAGNSDPAGAASR